MKNYVLSFFCLSLFFISDLQAFYISNSTSSVSARFSLTPSNTLNITVEGVTPLISFSNKSNKNSQLTGVASPTAANHAANKLYVDNQTTATLQTAMPLLPPIGSIIAWFKQSALSLPSNYVEVNGQTINDAQSPLNGVILPDLNGQNAVLAGQKVNATNTFVGNNDLTLTTNNLPAHSHSNSAAGIHGHSVSVTTSDHSHGINTSTHAHRMTGGRAWAGDTNGASGAIHRAYPGLSTGDGSGSGNIFVTSDSHSHTLNLSSHAHTVSLGNSSAHTHVIGSTGTGAAFNNRQRTLQITWVMRIK